MYPTSKDLFRQYITGPHRTSMSFQQWLASITLIPK